MKSKLLLSILLAVMAIAVAAVVWINASREPAVRPVSIEDERIVADAVLAGKLSGPRYFNVPATVVQEDGGPWIKVFDARSQMPRIVAERKLGPKGAREVELLIEKLTEQHPSRIIGGMRINLLRLNLSLDSIK